MLYWLLRRFVLWWQDFWVDLWRDLQGEVVLVEKKGWMLLRVQLQIQVGGQVGTEVEIRFR